MARVGIVFNGPPYSITEMIDAVVKAEEAGFDSAWQAEDVYGPDAIVPLACYAYATERIQMGTCVINPNTRAATLLASTFATLDQLSRGRMILGLGVGVTWLPMIGKTPQEVKSLTLMRETIQQFHNILRGEEVVVNGRRAIVFDRPVSLPKAFAWPCGGFQYPRQSIPIYIGTRGPKMMALAGELADGLICEHSIPLSEIKEWTQEFFDAVRHAGRDPRELQVVGLVLFSPSEDGQPSDIIKTFLARKVGILSAEEAAKLNLDPALVARIRAMWNEGKPEEARRFINPEVAHVFGAIGTPEECVAKLRSYHDAGLTVPLIFAEGYRLELALEAGAAYARQ